MYRHKMSSFLKLCSRKYYLIVKYLFRLSLQCFKSSDLTDCVLHSNNGRQSEMHGDVDGVLSLASNQICKNI